MTDTSKTARSVRGRRLTSIGAAFLATVALLLGAMVWIGCGGGDSSSSTEESDAASTTAVTVETVEAGMGEPVDTGSFVIEILSAGPSNLEMLPPQPESGHHFLGVNVSVINQGDTGVPLNGIPYSSSTAVLEADGAEYRGKLYVRPGPLLEGAVPPGRSIRLSFVFEIPDDTAEAAFVWDPVPAVTGYPRIAVAIPESALQPQ